MANDYAILFVHTNFYSQCVTRVKSKSHTAKKKRIRKVTEMGSCNPSSIRHREQVVSLKHAHTHTQ